MAAAPSKELPWDWVPPHASEAAKKEWQKPWYARAREFLFPDTETFRNYMLALLESFTVEELDAAIKTRRDLVEAFVVVGKLRHRMVKPFVRFALQRNHQQAFHWLVGWPDHPQTGPVGMLADLSARDPEKGRMLSTPDGWTWFVGECFELAAFFRWFARLDKSPYDWPEILPPPNHRPRAMPSLDLVPG